MGTITFIDINELERRYKEKMEDNLENIRGAEPKQLVDAKKYEGSKVKIARVEQKELETHWIEGVFLANETIKVPGLEIETEPLDELLMSDGTKKPLTVKAQFNLQKIVNPETKKEEIVFSKHPNSKLWKLMRKLGVTKLSEIKGKFVTIVTEPSKDPADDRLWLRISI